jgi:chromosome partitioning protein
VAVVRIFSVANQKGGVGKTTTAINLAAAMAKAGKRTLLIDLDPQCNATTGLGCVPTGSHGLLTPRALRDSVIATYLPGLTLLPGSRTFHDVEILAKGDQGEAGVLRDHLSQGIDGFDVVWIDCPPSTGPLTQSALAASSEVLMPIQCEYFAMEGLTQMIELIRNVMQRGGGRLEFGGIVLTMVDASLELTREVEGEVRDFFGESVFDALIPRDVLVSEAPSHGRSVLDYAPESRGAWAYIELCQEILEMT